MTKTPIKLLIIEDDPDDAKLLERLLQKCTLPIPEISWVQCLDDAAVIVRDQKFDLVLSDLGLPESTGIATVSLLKSFIERSPIIVLTGQDDENLGVAAIQAGANDYIPKQLLNTPILSRAIVHTIERFQMATRLVDANKLLESKNCRLAQMYAMSQQFVDNVSHEFRTPLTVIREFAAIIRDGIDGPVSPKQKKRLATLIDRTNDLSDMVDDLLDTSQLEAGLLKTCRREHDLGPIIFEVGEMLQSRVDGKNIGLHIAPIPSDLRVFCDEEKLRRILINLLTNAIKFTPCQGRIEIATEVVDCDRISISVEDTGPGIPKEELSRIFERFQQVEAHQRMAGCKGFGLGLNIARALASLNLGHLQVTSQEGKGSKFSVIVPTANIASILRCYFEQRTKIKDEDGYISLHEVHPDPFEFEDRENSVEIIDEFVRGIVKSFDLAIQTSQCRWSIFSCNANSNIPIFENRLLTEWEKIRASHYGAPLPKLVLTRKTTINISETSPKQFLALTKTSTSLNADPHLKEKELPHEHRQPRIQRRSIKVRSDRRFR